MRPYTGYYEDSEEFDDFAYDRSQALGKLIRAHRREDRIRHENRYREFNKSRMRRNEWDWDEDDDDWDSYDYDGCFEYSEDLNSYY